MLQRVAGLGMDWNLKKFLGINPMLEKITKSVLWLVLPDENSLISSSQLYKRILRMGGKARALTNDFSTAELPEIRAISSCP